MSPRPPAEPRLHEENISPCRSRFLFGPLTRGYADGLATMLRRALFEAAPGYAVDSVAVTGITDAYQPIPGADCDLADLALTMSRVALMSPTGVVRPVIDSRATACVTGPKDVTAGDLSYPAGLVAAEPNMLLFSLSAGCSVEISVTASCGRGSSMACDRTTPLIVGAVGVDALYSPVVSAVAQVRPTRSGDKVDLDELVLDVTCNGAIEPAAAVSHALCAIEEHLVRMMASLNIAPTAQCSLFESLMPDEALLADERPVEFLALTPSTYRLALRNGALTVGKVRCELRSPERLRSQWVSDTVATELASGLSRLEGVFR